MRYCRLIIITSLLNLLWTFSNSQQYIFNSQLLTTDDGLVNLNTYCIHKDQQGFLWVGTKHGLDRYDGYTFKHFNDEKYGLGYNYSIKNIFEDDSKSLWLEVHYLNNVSYYIFNPQTEKAVPVETYFGDRFPFDMKDRYAINQVRDRNLIWLSTKSGSVYFYQNNQFEKVIDRLSVPIKNLAIDKNDNIWIGGGNKLFYINRQGQILEEQDLPNQFVYFFLDKETDTDIWLHMNNEAAQDSVYTSIWMKTKNEAKLSPFFLTKDNQPITNYQVPFRSKTGLWYAYSNKQINIFNQSGKWLSSFDPLLDGNFNKTPSLHLFLESEVWFTSYKGLLKTTVKAPFFQLIKDNSISADFRGIAEDEKGNIYFSNRSLYRWNPNNRETEELLKGALTYGLFYKDSILWGSVYGSNDIGIQFNLRNKKLYSHPTTKEYGGIVTTILESNTPNLQILGHNSGISYLDLHNKIILPFEKYNDFEELKSLTVLYLHKNTKGIWLATNKGIFFMTEEEGILQYFNKASGHLPFDRINHIHEDNTGVFWLSSGGGGLIRWTPKLNTSSPTKFRQFTTQNGLPHNNLYAAYSDSYGRLWISSDKGLIQMHKQTHQVRTYTTKDGLPHNEFNLTSHYKAKDGKLYFGGLGGLITFHPDSIAQDSIYDVPIQFTDYQLLKEGNTEMLDLASLLATSNKIEIHPSDKLLELKFALLDFDDTENHRYSYQIEGYDNHWHTIEENFIRFTSLPYGNYTLKIKGQNINKGWSKQELQLDIFVLKPFYLQWWFITLVGIGLISIGIATVKWRIIQLENQKETLEIEVKKRTQKIEEDKTIIEAQAEKLKQLDKAKTRFFSNITHEFRTPLTLIIGPLEQIIENQPPPNIFKRRLNGVLNNAKHLLTLINQMLDLSKLESGQMQREVTKGDIVNYTREFVKRFEPLIEKKEHRFKFVSNQESWKTHFDKDKWDKIIYNLLSNALKFTPKGEVVQLSLMKTLFKGKEAIRLDVRDTGIGIQKNQLDQIFNRFYQADDSSQREQDGTGIGLALVKELVELQGGEIWVSSRVNHGTSFEIYLPVLDYEKGRVEQILELPAFPIVNKKIEKTVAQISVPISKKEGKLELLIIEDNEEIREYIQYCLDTSKYNISEAVNGEDGVLKAQSIVPDLIISDVMMPRKNGFQAVEEIREHIATSHIPIILLTAKASLESRLEGLKRGADAYLTKPFSPQELALRIEKLIELRQIIQHRYQNNLNNLPAQKEETFQKEDQFIIELKAYILENIENTELSVDEIGRNFGMSRVHLYRKLKALTNQSTSVFVRQIRLERAKALLKEGKLNISEITYQTGFASVSYFSRSFKKAFGMAPSEI